MPPARDPRIGEDLVDWLRNNFPPRCIAADENPIEAHRYSAKVELAQRLIRMADRKGAGRDLTIEME